MIDGGRGVDGYPHQLVFSWRGWVSTPSSFLNPEL